MLIDYVHAHVLPAAYTLLPHRMESQAATAMLLAIGLQESGFEHRKQRGGPAKGFWQFERGGGVVGVLQHRSTRNHALTALNVLQYPTASANDVYLALEHNDVLAAIFARLLLWTVPEPLPDQHRFEAGWDQYLAAWRPGKPHPDTWLGHYGVAWDVTLG